MVNELLYQIDKDKGKNKSSSLSYNEYQKRQVKFEVRPDLNHEVVNSVKEIIVKKEPIEDDYKPSNEEENTSFDEPPPKEKI